MALLIYPTFTFNAGSGSDTLASGAGPATAINHSTEGQTASYSGAGPYTITFSGACDLSGVSADGSHALFLQTSTGRKFFTIEGVDDGADTVTVTQAPAGTTSGLNWAIGGKRATLDNADSRLILGADALIGSTVELEDDQTITSSITFGGGISGGQSRLGFLIRSNTIGTHRVITNTANSGHFNWSAHTDRNVVFDSIEFHNSFTGTKTASAVAILWNWNSYIQMRNCILGDPAGTDNLYHGINRSNWICEFMFQNCAFINCVSHGSTDTYGNNTRFNNCAFIDNGGSGFIFTGSASLSSYLFENCLFDGNSGAGIYLDNASSSYIIIEGCTFAGNSSHGINLQDSACEYAWFSIKNNIFTNNGGYGINSNAELVDQGQADYNLFGSSSLANTSGEQNANMPVGDHDTSSSAIYDGSTFELAAAHKALGFPDNASPMAYVGNSHTYVDPGAFQREEPAGGAGSNIYRRGANNVLRM